VSLAFLPLCSYVVYSIPPVEGYDAFLWRSLAERQPKRVVYLSTTGVYGQQRDVNEHTPPSPRHDNDRQRVEAESAALAGPWQSIVLRPAAIYGPGRGIHESMARGRYRLVGSGDNFVSRIHVDDLAAHIEAALLSDVSGAWPVADEEPCTSSEIARFCADLLTLPVPDSIPAIEAHHTRRADRRVDGSGIRGKLGLGLRYPTYRLGIPASL
jgi:nucleoside-diphosphate-sugar epimerase